MKGPDLFLFLRFTALALALAVLLAVLLALLLALLPAVLALAMLAFALLAVGVLPTFCLFTSLMPIPVSCRFSSSIVEAETSLKDDSRER